MKSFYARSMWAVLGLIGLTQPLIAAEPFGSASLVPLPSTQVQHTGYSGYQEQIYSPSDQAPAPPLPAPDFQPFGPPPVGKMSNDYESAMKQSWHGGAGIACAEAACAPGCPCPHIFGYAGGLVMGRSNQCEKALSQVIGTYDTWLNTADARQQWAGGFEGRLGFVMPNCCNAFEATYWGIYPSRQEAAIFGSDFSSGIRPIMGANLDQLHYNDGFGTTYDVQQWMTNTSGIHYLERTYEFHNVEANFLGNTYAWGVVPFGAACADCAGCGPGVCGPRRLQFGWLGGFRYFQFNEGMNFYTDYSDPVLDGDPNELCYNVTTRNTLLGFQMGGQAAWYATNNLSFFGGGRFGVYNNHIEARQSIYGTGGDAYIANGTHAGEAYRFNTSTNVLAGLGQIDFGMRYQWGCHWSFVGGYRIVGITGVATAPSQIPGNFADSFYIQRVCAGDSVILHGAFAGGQFAW
jgi:hypothetical protein